MKCVAGKDPATSQARVMSKLANGRHASEESCQNLQKGTMACYTRPEHCCLRGSARLRFSLNYTHINVHAAATSYSDGTRRSNAHERAKSTVRTAGLAVCVDRVWLW